MRLLDCHTHTCHSFDSEAPVEKMFRRAAELSLEIYAITDHCECNLYESDGHNRMVRESLEAARKLQQQSDGRGIKVIAGVELGQPLQNLKAAEEVLSLGFDYVIGSLHNLNGMEDFYFLPYQQYAQQELDQLMERYFSELLEMVRWNGFDTLAHFTYPFRYFAGVSHLKVDTSQYENQICAVFRTLIDNQKALEINTSGLDGELGALCPDEWYLQLYRDLGGKFVTLGSDAHAPEQLAKGIEVGLHTAHQLGLQPVYFEKRNMKWW